MKCIDEIILGLITIVGLTALFYYIDKALDCPSAYRYSWLPKCIEQRILIERLGLSADLSCIIVGILLVGFIFLAIKLDRRSGE